MSDQVLVDTLVTRGATREEAEGFLKMVDIRRRHEWLWARKLPPGLRLGSDEAAAWCTANGGHIDNGGMFYSTCPTCCWTDL